MALVLGGSVALVSTVNSYFSSPNQDLDLNQPTQIEVIDERSCGADYLLEILLELRIQYTPYYLHYFHMVQAVE